MKINLDTILEAYTKGIFPMADSHNDKHVNWIKPKYRGIIPLKSFHISKSLRRVLRKEDYEIRIDSNFEEVIAQCSKINTIRENTWINKEIIDIFKELFYLGYVHTVETWRKEKLIGGLYGLSLGGAFFGESMFSISSNASKIALCYLVANMKKCNYKLLDTQFLTDHLKQFGGIEITHEEYLKRLGEALNIKTESNFLSSSIEIKDFI